MAEETGQSRFSRPQKMGRKLEKELGLLATWRQQQVTSCFQVGMIHYRFDDSHQGLHFIIYKIKGLEFSLSDTSSGPNFRTLQVWWENGAEKGYFAEDHSSVLEVRWLSEISHTRRKTLSFLLRDSVSMCLL